MRGAKYLCQCVFIQDQIQDDCEGDCHHKSGVYPRRSLGAKKSVINFCLVCNIVSDSTGDTYGIVSESTGDTYGIVSESTDNTSGDVLETTDDELGHTSFSGDDCMHIA